MNLKKMNTCEYLLNRSSEENEYDIVPNCGENEAIEHRDREVESIYYLEETTEDEILIYFRDGGMVKVNKGAEFELTLVKITRTAMVDL